MDVSNEQCNAVRALLNTVTSETIEQQDELERMATSRAYSSAVLVEQERNWDHQNVEACQE